MTDLLIIKPGAQKRLYQSLSDNISGLEPPLWAALLAGYIRDKGFSVKIQDLEIDKPTFPRAKLTAIVVSGTNPSASTMNMIGARTVLKTLRWMGDITPTILMGLHPSALPLRTIREEPVDMVCQGEGFSTLWALLTDEPKENIPGLVYRIGTEAIRVNPRAKLTNPDLLPMPAWDLLPMDKYRAHNWHVNYTGDRSHYGVIYTSLGCPFHCRFCCINAMFGEHRIRLRAPSSIIEEIDYLVDKFRVHNLKIIDEMFDLNIKHVAEVCGLITSRRYDLNIWAYARVDTINKEKLYMMKKAGINWLGIGIESGNQLIREHSSKGSFDNERVINAVKMIKDADINVGGNYIFGLPDDTHETMTETLEMAKKLNCEFANFNILMPYPGSQLYAELQRDNNPEDWAEYSQYGYETKPQPTSELSPRSIVQFRDQAFNDYYNGRTFQDMILNRYGQDAIDNINRMLEHTLKRKLLEEP